MLRWLLLFWGICRGQNKPQDLPFSAGLFWILLFMGIILDTLNLRITYRTIEFDWAIITTLGHTVIYYSSLAIFLYLMGFSNRINQTLNSVLGCSLIIGLLATPLYLLLNNDHENTTLPIVLFLGLNIWMLFIIAHILRHALSISYPIAFILSIGFFMLNMVIGDLFLSDLTSELAADASPDMFIEPGKQN